MLRPPLIILQKMQLARVLYFHVEHERSTRARDILCGHISQRQAVEDDKQHWRAEAVNDAFVSSVRTSRRCLGALSTWTTSQEWRAQCC